MPNTSAPPAPRSPQRTQKSGAERILEAAEHLFSAQGFDAVSMSAIAHHAGVSKANIYHHFATKQELYLAVLAQACRETGNLLQDMENNPGSLAQKLGYFADEHLFSILRHEPFSRLILRELLENGPQRGKELAERGFGENFARLAGILRAGQARGELRRDVDPAMAATLLIGANVFFFEARDVLHHYPDVDFSAEPARYSQMLVDILLHGIAAIPPRNDNADKEQSS